jgi:trimeric autotransporter adhesin
MRKHKILTATVLGFIILGRVAFFGGAVLADPTPSGSPSPSPSASASPSPSPSSSPSPSASPSPSPSASPSPSPKVGPTKPVGPTSTPGVTGPTGPQNGVGPKSTSDTGPGKCTGEIPNYVFDATTGKWVAADKSSFTCDMTTGLWLSPEYYYDTQDGWYEILPQNSTPPSYMVTAPNVVHTVFGDLQVGSPTYQVAQALGLLDPTDGIVSSTTGPNSNNNSSISNNNQNWFDLTNLVNIISTLQSNATSGNVSAASNTNVGSAVSGAANVLSDLINLLASAWSWSNGNLTFFMQNIGQMGGTTNGNILLDPTQSTTGGGGSLGSCSSAANSNTGSNSNNNSTCTNTNGLNVNAQSTGNITNNVNLAANSGNASATDNTNAGNVSSGNATAEINIINLINSLITSGNSFFGILNIFGNYNGDILFPNGFLNGLLGSSAGSGDPSNTNTGPNSTNNASSSNNNQTTINNTSNNSVANNIGLEAASGQASSDSNTTAGSTRTGAANTTESLFNLSNQDIFGSNAVLVIVNVLGHWVGTIMNLPGGATESALLTGDATTSPNVSNSGTGPNSNNNASVSNNNNANINTNSTGTITNNVNVGANSGNATAKDNTSVGNVSTGNANASASVANIFNSILNIKNWFGVLVINVFGDWTGDVNQNSGAAKTANSQNKPATTTSNGPLVQVKTTGTKGGTGTTTVTTGGSNTNSSSGASSVTSSSNSNNTTDNAGKVLAAATTGVPLGTNATSQNVLFLGSALVLLIAGALASVDKRFRKRSGNK